MTSDTNAAKDKPVSGYAALEAKVEEIQAQTASDASVVAAEGIPSPSTSPDLASLPEPPEGGQSPSPSVAPGASVLSALQDSLSDVVRLQSETFARLAQVRGPADLLSAQLAYGQRVFELQMNIWSRVAKATPVVPPISQ